MESGLPINVRDLITQKTIEQTRIEYKATWDDTIKKSSIRTICAFANDLLNLNGGYIILGIETDSDSKPIIPPRGMENNNLDLIQRQISGSCKESISPNYTPLIYLEKIENIDIVVIWCPAGDNRPYEAPKKDRSGRTYYIRSGSITIEATGDTKRQLLELAAKIPWDDRRCIEGNLNDISIQLVKQFLNDIRSYLSVSDIEIDNEDLYKKLQLIVKVNNHFVPRNVALLFFNNSPETFFSGAFIEVAQFGNESGDLIEEKEFKGPIQQQVKSCLSYLEGMGGRLLQKILGQAEVDRTVPYPYEALEESIVNAVYHRGYDAPGEPVKIYLYPDRIEIISYPGPVAGIDRKHFLPNKTIPPVPARNRRIGELLKELRLAERRGTGIPKIQKRMQENGSPLAEFDFDEEMRTYFKVTLPVHPKYQVIHAIREASHLSAIGDKTGAFQLLAKNYEKQPTSGALAAQIIEYAFDFGNPDHAKKVLEQFKNIASKSEDSQPFLMYAKKLIENKQNKEAQLILNDLPPIRTYNDTFETAILSKKIGDYKGAHKLFKELVSLKPNDPQILHDFAQTKTKLASKLRSRQDIGTKKRLTKEAIELLRAAIQLSQNQREQSWCWYDLAKSLNWLRSPKSEVEAAFLQALSLNSDEQRFINTYNEWKLRNTTE